MSKGRLALECAECGSIAFSIEAAEAHEIEENLDTPEDELPHGGWDTIRLDDLTSEEQT